MKKRIIAYVIAAIMALSMIACAPEKPPVEPDDGGNKVEETDTYIVENGNSDYKIVMPSGANSTERYAASELQFFINDATGVKLEIITDEGLKLDENAKYLSVGDTAIRKDSGLVTDYAELNTDGFKIKTYGNTVVMASAKQNGTLYAAYEFLELNFGYEYFAIDEWKINKTDTVKLLNIEYTDVPDFEGRWVTCQTLNAKENEEWCYRARLTGGQGIYFTNTVTPWSTLNDQSMMYQIMPYEKYKDRNGWLSGDEKTGQLCITTATYNDEMFNEFCNNLINNYVAVEKNAKIFMLGINDHRSYCKCDTCMRDYEKYRQSGVMIRFCNKVADRVQEWIDENQPGREFYICMFAYLYTIDPPVNYDNETGKYVPLDPSVIANDRVMVRIAPINSVNMYPHTDMDHNGIAATAFAAWPAVASNLCVWDYGTNFHSYIAPYPDWGTLQENFLMYKSIGVSDILTQTPAHTSGTGFYAMTIYLRSQLMWDINQNFDGLVNKFMANYYKSGADAMREYYDYLRSVYEIAKEKGIYVGNIYGTVLYDTKLWSYDNMMQIQRIFDRAFAENEKIRETDPKEYEIVNTRLKTESLFYRFVILRNFSSYYSVNQRANMIDEFESDASVANLTGVGREVNNNPTSKDVLSTIIAAWRAEL